MLTLLKIGATGLPVPKAAPRKEMHVGQYAMALGRTWTGVANPPSVSVGIISALDRIWGKAIQTDAKVSPVNYGGPLVDIQGRVLGVLVPASPRAQEEAIAGVEWYDSGIGFAIPLEDAFAVLSRLQKGQDLNRGLLGIVPKNPPEKFGVPAVVASILPNSAADRAGMKADDTIIEIDGVKVSRPAQVLHALGTKYEGDVVSVKVQRGKEQISFKGLKLTGAVPAYDQGFFGVLPMRDDPEKGVEVRYVYPQSPADKAGIKAKDRIVKVGREKKTAREFAGRNEFILLTAGAPVGAEAYLEVRRAGAKDPLSLTLKLAEIPQSVPDKLPEPASLKKALAQPQGAGRRLVAPVPADKKPEPKKSEERKPADKPAAAKKPELGLVHRANAAADQEYWFYVPDNYDPNIAHALVLWLHPPGKGSQKDFEALADLWKSASRDKHIILVFPRAQNETGWLASDAGLVTEALGEVARLYTVDRQRIVAHGIGTGGQMAFYLGFHARDLIRAVAVIDSLLTIPVPEQVPAQRLSFFVLAGKKDPLLPSLAEVKTKLGDKKYPLIYEELPDQAGQYLDANHLEQLVRWIDSLDRV
jgi:S1-C subfamily serine protease/dienelactone hydrolase